MQSHWNFKEKPKFKRHQNGNSVMHHVWRHCLHWFPYKNRCCKKSFWPCPSSCFHILFLLLNSPFKSAVHLSFLFICLISAFSGRYFTWKGLGLNQRLHCNKRLLIFPSSAGMSLTNLSLAGNNLIFPGQGEFGQWHSGWGRENLEPFLQCS